MKLQSIFISICTFTNHINSILFFKADGKFFHSQESQQNFFNIKISQREKVIIHSSLLYHLSLINVNGTRSNKPPQYSFISFYVDM